MQSGAMDISGLLKQLSSGEGWDTLDESKVRARQQRDELIDNERRMAEARIVSSALSTSDGQRFLEWLLAKSMMAPLRSYEIDAPAEQFTILAAQRQGKALLVQEVLSLLAFARGQTNDEVTQ